MSYHRKVIYISLGILIGVSLLITLAMFLFDSASGPAKLNELALGFGLSALAFSLVETTLLVLTGLVILIVKPTGGSEHVVAPENLLDAANSRIKPLTHTRRAGAFFAAAGIVALLGGSLCLGSLGFGGLNI